MRYTDNAINIITAKTYKGIGRAWINKVLKGNENVATIVGLLNSKSRQESVITIDDFIFDKTQLMKQMEVLQDSCDGIVAIGDRSFPKYRGNVKEGERPIFLFYKGDLQLLDIEHSCISVIGLLNPDENIESREKNIVAEIVKNDIIVVSGLAFGCDSIAHKEALVGGKTIAILPSSLHTIMPAKNRSLAYEIVVGGGLLISEYYDQQKSAMDLSSRYKDRDRLQALFCDAIVLAASYAPDTAERWQMFGQKLDSGARLAMGFARDYGIARAVMYDQSLDESNPMFDLNRQLIAEQKNITVLTKKSLQGLIDNIKYAKRNIITRNNFDTDLFTGKVQ